MVGKADGHGQGVGGIPGRTGRELEERPHHPLHLLLGLLTVTGHRLLDHHGGELGHRKAGLHEGQDEHPAGMAELQGGTGIDRGEDILHCRVMRLVGGDHLADADMEFLKPFGKGFGRGGTDHAAGHEKKLAAALVDNAVAGHPRTRVDAEQAAGGPARLPVPRGGNAYEMASMMA